MIHRMKTFKDYPNPAPSAHRDYTPEHISRARVELESHNYGFCDKTGTQYESGSWCVRYSNPIDYNPNEYQTRESIWYIFAWAIKARAARIYNRETM